MVVPGTASNSFSSRRQPAQRNHRAASPPLEKDEKEFTQTARGMQRRKLSKDDTEMGGVPSQLDGHHAKSTENEALFGRNLNVPQNAVFTSSPAMKPSLSVNVLKRSVEESTDLWAHIENNMDWDMRSPENIELEELDDLLDDF